MKTLLPLLLAASPALARHTPEAPVTDYSAYTLDQFELRAGIFRLEFGILDSLQISTFPIIWLLKVNNGVVKYRPYDDGTHAVSVELGIFQLDLADFIPDEEEEAGTRYPIIRAIPFTAMASRREGDFTLNLGASFTAVSIDGEVSDSDLSAVGGASTVMLKPAVEWRLGPVLAVVLEGRVKLYERYSGNVVTTYEIDEDSSLDVYGTGGFAIEGFKGNASASLFWSWDTFNLRLGAGYGHFAVPAANVFLPDPSWFPELDMYWRF